MALLLRQLSSATLVVAALFGWGVPAASAFGGPQVRISRSSAHWLSLPTTLVLRLPVTASCYSRSGRSRRLLHAADARSCMPLCLAAFTRLMAGSTTTHHVSGSTGYRFDACIPVYIIDGR